MPSWDSQQYLKFADERTQPSVDLVARIPLVAPARIVDLGCGPGNSTAVLRERWRTAEITGVDSSPDMLARAAKDYPREKWEQADITSWAPARPFDLVFSNATLHWVPAHDTVFPALFGQVNPGGVLAVQMPHNQSSPSHAPMREIAASGPWAEKLRAAREINVVHGPGYYYDLLAPLAAQLFIWETDYIHVMADVPAILEWVRGTGLRPFLDALSPDEQAAFTRLYLARLRENYPPQPDGRVLFPFRRLFIVAVKGT